ncbi:50S ribosomal protein L3 N(5)-glutamine methyltransferase [Hyphomicrobium sp.]|jgi:ribosomal protein L3 glutamine methyltransferase|uniref:50S ribosomal protein L3 N(5)-glutamine methyltransferase n=1 Tax=Hyphomicrobium sp. TaxID=82 RepID=UPI002C2FA6BB|nr:50S ribosomal protein L3 N(5)-glutamine methyltransferase [Hyphomicrobium sp.]HVZ04764.1 50S ribosomal protein L3 N(5)-glutamine methyltransferase [Hyphomicrobium sp.]
MAENDRQDVEHELVTVRDWLRYAVTAMTRAGLVFGHGTDNAVDEAAFLILSTLDLPIDDINAWLDCRLLLDERKAINAILSRRIKTRKPAAYLTNRAYIQGYKFYVDERVIVPRSFIGELLARDALASVIDDATAIRRVLDLCTGSGCLAILAADAFPKAEIHASDLSADALAVAEHNIKDYGLQDRIRLFTADLFDGLRPVTYDLIISNPPYVAAEEVAAFSPEYRAEPQLAHLGGVDGLDLVRRILADAPERLSANGSLVVEIGTGQERLEATRPDLPFFWLDTESSCNEVFSLTASDFKPARTRRKS